MSSSCLVVMPSVRGRETGSHSDRSHSRAEPDCTSNGPDPRAPHGAAPQCAVSELSAEELHRLALLSFRAGNRSRLRLIRTLRLLRDTRLHFELGFPSIVAYSQQYFGFRKSETYQSLRVAESLDALPGCASEFSDGRVGWSALKQITRVAVPATEGEWLTFAAGKSVDAVRAEVEHAVSAGRDRPRDRRYGLPDLKVRVQLEMTRTEHEIFRRAMETVCGEIAESLSGQRVSLTGALLFLSEKLLAGESARADSADAGSDSESLQGGPPSRTLLYHVCPDCRRGRMETQGGGVEVSPAVIDRIEGNSRREVIDPAEEVAVTRHVEAPEVDRPNSPSLRRKVLLRDGRRCANPCCGRPAEHCHHIIYRRDGGRTALWNETAVCGRCHALIHAGLLLVSGDPALELQWVPRGGELDRRPNFRPEADAEELIAVKPAPPEGEFARADNHGRARPRTEDQSARADSLDQMRAVRSTEAVATRAGSGPQFGNGALSGVGPLVEKRYSRIRTGSAMFSSPSPLG